MNERLSKSRFKPRVLEYLRQVEDSGKPLIVTDRGVPVVEIRRYTEAIVDPLERLRGTVKRHDDPLAPVGVGDWNALS